MLIDSNMGRDGDCPVFRVTRRDPHLRVQAGPKTQDTIDVAVVQIEYWVKTCVRYGYVGSLWYGKKRPTSNGYASHVSASESTDEVVYVIMDSFQADVGVITSCVIAKIWPVVDEREQSIDRHSSLLIISIKRPI